MPDLPLITRARSHRGSIAFRTTATTHTYQDLLDRSAVLAARLLGAADDLEETRVALLVPAGFAYVAVQWAIWRAGGITVPICLSATEPEWEYALTDSGAGIVVTDSAMGAKVAPLCARLDLRLVDIDTVAAAAEKTLPEIAPKRRAMIPYTSGPTSKPKTLLTTQRTIPARIDGPGGGGEWAAPGPGRPGGKTGR